MATVPTSTGCLPFVGVRDVVDDRLELGLLGAIDHVRHVVADHGLVGGHHDHFQVVDALELLFLGLGRAGHAGQLVVHAEEVLEGDGRQRHGFLLHLDAFLGLDGLVQTFAVAPAFHQAAGEFVHDDHFAVADDVVLVALEERMGAQGIVQVGDHLEVFRAVQVFDAQPLFDAAMPSSVNVDTRSFSLTT